eukprot:CAMPEP_0172663964 /NCGR_PEP_ID=MMETSP1074-20121228/6280_1 /TAXON_ID=2916 /ORGANISM="Ceratium fusus, Strain PA161109" /LENGTH=229 /DNA_ID=CAMNT_0013480039 /DNA_START=73 /DNA_END=759 /DNA_ORIENTATION=-
MAWKAIALTLVLRAWMLVVCDQTRQHDLVRLAGRGEQQAIAVQCPTHHSTRHGQIPAVGLTDQSLVLLQMGRQSNKKSKDIPKEDLDYINDDDKNIRWADSSTAGDLSNKPHATTCVTDTPHSKNSPFAWHVVNSPSGTPCVFGADTRDEGWHCIMDAGRFGSLGWCWTSKSKSSWGSCSESCPLFGPARVLGKKIDALRDNIRRLGKQVVNTSMIALGSSSAKTGSHQ